MSPFQDFPDGFPPDMPDAPVVEYKPKEPSELTPEQKKLENWLENRLESESFNAEILRIRKKYKIPAIGLVEVEPFLLFDWPTNWYYMEHYSWYMQRRVTNELLKLIQKFQLLGVVPQDLHCLLFYNQKFIGRSLSNLLSNLEYGNLSSDRLFCVLTDVAEMKKIERANKKPISRYYKVGSQLDKFYPICIRISPYACVKDILRFINNNKDDIESALKEYQEESVSLGKLRTKDSEDKKLYNFIWDLYKEGIKQEEIAELVNRKFAKENYTQGHVARVLKIMKNRRK